MVITKLLYDLLGKYGVFAFISISLSLAIRKLIESNMQKNKQKPFLTAKKGITPNIRVDDETVNGESPECEDDTISTLPEDLQHIPFHYTALSDQEMLRRSENFYILMNKRRTIRYFSQEPVPVEIIRNIVKTAGTSPSGAHTEPWTFVVVQDPFVKQQIREVVEEEEHINYTRRMGKQWTADLKAFKTNWNKPYLTDAPYLILVFKQLYSFTDTGARKNHYYNEISVAIASGMLLMAIQNAGLVTLTSTPLQCGGRLRDILGRPETERLTLLLPVGKPAAYCSVPDLARKEFHEICIEI